MILMLSLSAFGTEKFFNIDYKFGQDDLLKFAQYSKENNKTLSCLGFTHKYSLIYYGGKPVYYSNDKDLDAIKNELNKNDNLVIMRKKDISDGIKSLNYNILQEGRRYILMERK